MWVVWTAALLLPSLASAQSVLGSGELRILGVKLAVSPATQTVPRNQATGSATALIDGSASASQDPLPPSISDPSLANLVVKGELSGPGIGQTEDGSSATGVTISAPVGQLLPIPPLLSAGTYVVDNLRLEACTGGSGCATSNFIMPADPAVATIKVVDRIIVTSVSSRPLSLDEIRDRGIIIDDSSFTAYEFTFGVGTQSQGSTQPITLAVAFPQDPSIATDGPLDFPPALPSLQIPNLEVKGLKLEGPDDLFDKTVIPPIPAVIVIPGNIAFLNQFFQVIVLVSNVAPAGSHLVVTSATATMLLPPGPDAVAQTADDPLRFAQTQGGPSTGVTDLHNTTDGSGDFAPGQDANGEFLVEALKEGTHRLEVTINAQLQGLPIGNVALSGKAVGTVLVRNPTFALTFNHPNVVRAGETYSLFVTIHNTSSVDANLVTLSLDPSDVIGATLTGARYAGTEAGATGTVVVPTITANDAQTVEFTLIAQKNGQVTATGFADSVTGTGGGPVSGTFILRTGIGDRGIPLSPESLTLPPYAQDLPADFLTTAMRVLGLAHSVATAPQGAPIGISTPIDSAVVAQRGQQLAEAGLRVRIGEAGVTAVGDLMLDWLGGTQAGTPAPPGGTPAPPGTSFDPGFDEVMRTTHAGHDLESAWAGIIQAAQAGTPAATVIDYQATFAEADQYRPSFVSVAATSGATISIADDQGRRTAVESQQSTVERDIPSAVILGVSGGELAVVGRRAQAPRYASRLDIAQDVQRPRRLPSATKSPMRFRRRS
jgi:hypothetical protein